MHLVSTIWEIARVHIIKWGIEANPMKITAITDIGAPATIKDMQKLTGCMAALNRFISRLGERGLPFFKLLK
jgi:ribonuclease HI